MRCGGVADRLQPSVDLYSNYLFLESTAIHTDKRPYWICEKSSMENQTSVVIGLR